MGGLSGRRKDTEGDCRKPAYTEYTGSAGTGYHSKRDRLQLGTGDKRNTKSAELRLCKGIAGV